MEATTQGLFSWIPFFEQLADRLIGWRDRQAELIGVLHRLHETGQPVPDLKDVDTAGNHVPLAEVDPFTVLALINRGMSDVKRRLLAATLGETLGVAAAPPADFAGIPIVHNQKAWFIQYARDRSPGDVPALWEVFGRALGPAPLDDAGFAAAFDAALKVKGVRFNLTMGLFWIRPKVFLSLDGVLQGHAKLSVKASRLNALTYIDSVRQVAARGVPFPQLSYDAWLAARAPSEDGEDQTQLPGPEDVAVDPSHVPVFWFVGAYWNGDDQTERFIENGIWENGYDDRFAEEVKSMRPGERIAIKAAHTRRHGLPFDARGKAASVMSIKAIGIVLSNPGDGRRVGVAWGKVFEPARPWYFFTNRQAVWGVRRGKTPYNDFLVDFTFDGRDQDHDWFLRQPYWAKWLGEEQRSGIVAAPRPDEELEEGAAPEPAPMPDAYGIDDLVKEGVFVPRAELEGVVRLLRTKKNVILQGPPGVGKTFLAKRLAFAMLDVRDPARVSRVQFHQSMSYEDFVRGLRPKPGAGGFELTDGPFIELAEAARASPDERPHVLIVEEINRGNPSGIFGELLTLLEADKRDPENAVRLTNQRQGEAPFHVPPNLHVIGTMNLADRSLAVLDHALRRRFAFVALRPGFGDAYARWCDGQGLPGAFAADIASRVGQVNRMIEDDAKLGPNFLVGHSYFCPRRSDLDGMRPEAWYREVVATQVLPLLQEYWFDDNKKVDEARSRLLAGIA